MSKIALITGASGGIGSACARVLYENGVTVAIGYHTNEQVAHSLLQELPGCIAVQGDVSRPGDVNRMVDTVLERFGKIDILINNAGIAHQGLLTDLSDEDWARICGINLSGTLYGCRAVLPHMVARGGGSIVNVSSMWGICGASCEAAYSAAKAGVIGLTKALAQEVGPAGVRVNCVAPGVIDTEMNAALTPEDKTALADQTPLGRTGNPTEVARAVWYLASEDSSFVTGQVLSVNGGLVI